MNSGPVDHTKHPADPTAPPRSLWLQGLRLGISLLILATLWLIYPLISIRVCAARIAGFYEPAVDSGTGQITGYVYRRTTDSTKVREWEERLEGQPTPRLLALLPSRDPIGVWVVSRAIENQFRGGQFVGWPGKREPVPPLDADGAELIIRMLDQDLPVPAKLNLLAILATVPADQPHYRGMLLKATESQEPIARAFGVRILNSMEVHADETVELVDRLAADPVPPVRATLVESLVAMMRPQAANVLGSSDTRAASMMAAAPATGGSMPPQPAGPFASSGATATMPAGRGPTNHPSRDHYRRILLAAMHDDAEPVRSAATNAIEVLDLELEEVSDAIVKMWNDASEAGRWSLFTKLMNRAADGTPRQLPAKLVEAMLDNPAKAPSGWSFEYVQRIAFLPGVPIERQWQLIEAELTSPENQYSYELRNALFSPREPVGSAMSQSIDWNRFRKRFLSSALAAKPRLLEWTTEAIKSEDENTVLSGVALLAVIAPEEPDRMTPALSHTSAKVRVWALRSLIPSAEQLPQLFELLRDQEADVRNGSAAALIRYTGSLSEAQLDQLVAAFLHGDFYSYWPHEPSFLDFLQKRASGRFDLKKFLIDCLRSDSAHVRDQGVRMLPARGELAQEAWPHLVEGIRAGRLHGPAGVLVIEAGRPIEDPEVARRLLKLLLGTYWSSAPNPSEPANRQLLLQKLTKLCPTEFTSTDFMDEVTEILGVATEESQRAEIARRFSDLPVDPTAALPRLRELLNNGRWETRQGAAYLVGAWGPKAKAATGLLIERLAEDSEVRVRIAAAQALGEIGPDAGPEAAAALAQSAKRDKMSAVQVTALDAIGKMKPHIKAHRATLEEVSKLGDPMVRKAAAKILIRLDAENQ